MIKHLYIECSHTAITGLNTGIQRVVRNVVNQLGKQLADGTPITLVRFDDGDFYVIEELPDLRVGSIAETDEAPEKNEAHLSCKTALKSKLVSYLRSIRAVITNKITWSPLHAFLSAPRTQFGLSGILYTITIKPYKKLKLAMSQLQQQEVDNTPVAVKFLPGDVLLMPDASWDLDIWQTIAEVKKNGATIIVVVYDLIPITHPNFCEPVHCKIFNTWVEEGKTKVDGYIAISKTVMRSVQDHLRSKSVIIEENKFGYFYLGADIVKAKEHARLELKNTISKENSYLIVSTIEPRKNHQYLLDTFNELWARGGHVKLHIVGRIGWKVEQLLQNIKEHPQLNKQLFIWNDLDDAELVYCYKNSKALLFPSYVEGFGLPIIEAQHHKLPVLASDTPIHREVGGESIIYFDIENVTDLVEKISEVEAGKRLLKDSVNFEAEKFTWENSAGMLAQEVQRISSVVSSRRYMPSSRFRNSLKRVLACLMLRPQD